VGIDSSPREPELVRRPEQIQSLLKRLLAERCLIQIRHPASNEAHVSALLGLKPPQGLYLDAPVDSVIDLYRKGDALEVHSDLKGTAVRFATRLQLFSRYEGYPALLCDWPKEVHYHERRNSFRVRVSGEGTRAQLSQRDSGQAFDARLVDLSLGGFGALVEQGAHLETREVLDCELVLGETSLSVEATVQSFEAAAGTRFFRLGARFMDIGPGQERQLSKLVLELERQAIMNDRGR